MNFHELKLKLPTSSQSFAGLRSKGKVYVDKTAYVYELAACDSPQILIRPRRFGKSTLLTTIEELFRHGVKPYDGHPSFFQGLAIEELWQDEETYPVLRLNLHKLNSNCNTAAQFEQNLMLAVANFCDEQQLQVSAKLNSKLVAMVASKPLRFMALFEYMLELLPRPLVLLIDEFDAPIIHHYHQKNELNACKLILSSLFDVIKDAPDKFRCVFCTGITRFQDLDLGMSVNNLTDVSLDEEFAACCGYTRDELKQYFAQHLRYAAAVRNGCEPEAVSNQHIETLLDDMSEWYDGYSFDGTEHNKVFSTWSVLRFFADAKARLQPYWSTENGQGVPKVLKIALDRIDVPQLLADMRSGDIEVDYEEFMQSSLVNPEANPYSLLFQTGYLTFQQPFNNGDDLYLKSPNREIDIAFGNLLCQRVFNMRKKLYSLAYINKTVPILASLDAEQIRAHFNSLFEELPSVHYPIHDEATVQGYIFFHLRALGLKPRLEVITSSGRADCVFDLHEYRLTIVFEFKFESSADAKKLDAKLKEALQQIKARKYALNASSEPTVARFGLVFCGEPGNRGFARVELADVVQVK